MSHAYSVVTVEKKLFFFISATLIPIRLKLFCVYNAYDSIDHLRGEQIEIFFLFRCLLLGAFFYPLNTEIRHSIQCMHFVYFSIRFLLDAQTDSFVHIARRLLVISSILLDFRIACSAMGCLSTHSSVDYCYYWCECGALAPTRTFYMGENRFNDYVEKIFNYRIQQSIWIMLFVCVLQLLLFREKNFANAIKMKKKIGLFACCFSFVHRNS